MPRPLILNRDQAEMLDDILLAKAEAEPAMDVRLIDVAECLRETWGWSRWDKRPDAKITKETYEAWLRGIEEWLVGTPPS